jgi:hypothetical protein
MDNLPVTREDQSGIVPAHAGGLPEVTAEIANYSRAIRRCQHKYRAALDAIGVCDQDAFLYYLDRAGNELDSGEFFLSRLGRLSETDPLLSMAMLVIRIRWIEEYDAAGSAEKLLIDQALIAFYHMLRLHELAGNIEARAEHEFFGEAPLRWAEWDRKGVCQTQADEYLHRVSERLLPAIERCQRMLTRSLRELRACRATRLTIAHAEQVNVAQQQIVAALREPNRLA